MRLTLFPALLVLALLCVSGCGDSGSGKKPAPSGGTAAEPGAAPATPAPAGNGRTQIGFIAKGDSPSWKAVRAGAMKAVQEGRHGPDGRPILDVVWVSTKEGGQPDAAKELIGKGVAAIVIAPQDEKSLTDVLAAAGRVPVVAIDTNLSATGVRSVIAPDTTKSDELAKKGRAKVEGFAISPDDLAKLKAGELDTLIAADPLELGALAVKAAKDCIAEKKVEKRIDVSWHVITKDNLDSPEISPLLNPPVEKYLKD